MQNLKKIIKRNTKNTSKKFFLVAEKTNRQKVYFILTKILKKRQKGL